MYDKSIYYSTTKWVQQELICCGKSCCKKCSGFMLAHGPYWYGYYTERGRQKSYYIGKELPEELHKLAAAFGRGPLVQGDLPGQQVLAELEQVQAEQAQESWRDKPAEVAEAMGIPWPATREQVRKFVVNKMHAKHLDHNAKVALQSLFCRLCGVMGWSAPKLQSQAH